MNKYALLLLAALVVASVYYANQQYQSQPNQPQQPCVEGDVRGGFCVNSSALAFQQCVSGAWLDKTTYCAAGTACFQEAASQDGSYAPGCVAVQVNASVTPSASATPSVFQPSLPGNYSPDEPACGDGFCALAGDYAENCSSCPQDCGCAAGDYCAAAGYCEPKCGNGVCDAGETSGSCCVDCACGSGLKCDNSSMACFQPLNFTQSQALAFVSQALNASGDSLANYTYSVSDYRDAAGEAFKRVTLNCRQESEYACGMVIDVDYAGGLTYWEFN